MTRADGREWSRTQVEEVGVVVHFRLSRKSKFEVAHDAGRLP